jgi:hypothetical protein
VSIKVLTPKSNVSETARNLGMSRDMARMAREVELKDLSRYPHHGPTKTKHFL